MKKYIIGFLMGMFVCGLISVSAAKYLYKAEEVSYDSKDITWNVDNVDSAIKSLYSMINDANSALTNLKNTDIAKAVGANGNSFESVINQLGTIVNQGDKSFTISDTNGMTIPAGYYNGQGTIKTSDLIPTPTATKTITSNGSNIDVTNFKSVSVSVPQNAFRHAVTALAYGSPWTTLDFGRAISDFDYFIVWSDSTHWTLFNSYGTVISNSGTYTVVLRNFNRSSRYVEVAQTQYASAYYIGYAAGAR